MLNQVLGIVESERWFDTRQPFEKTLYLSQGSSQCVLLSRNGVPDTFVKFSNLINLAVEAGRCRLSHERFPGHTAAFLGYAERHSLQVLATRAVGFVPVSGTMMFGSRLGGSVQLGLEDLFRQMNEGPAAASSRQQGHAWFEGLQSYFDGHELQATAAIGMQRLAQALPSLPALSQHGDLVLNNLGLRPNRELVIFDWEDYGAVMLPGLDLFTLDNSIRQDLDLRRATSPSPRSACGLDVGRLTAALGLSRQLYEELKLGYALVFRYLKRNYNAEVRARVDQLIHELAGTTAPNGAVPQISALPTQGRS